MWTSSAAAAWAYATRYASRAPPRHRRAGPQPREVRLAGLAQSRTQRRHQPPRRRKIAQVCAGQQPRLGGHDGDGILLLAPHSGRARPPPALRGLARRDQESRQARAEGPRTGLVRGGQTTLQRCARPRRSPRRASSQASRSATSTASRRLSARQPRRPAPGGVLVPAQHTQASRLHHPFAEREHQRRCGRPDDHRAREQLRRPCRVTAQLGRRAAQGLRPLDRPARDDQRIGLARRRQRSRGQRALGHRPGRLVAGGQAHPPVGRAGQTRPAVRGRLNPACPARLGHRDRQVLVVQIRQTRDTIERVAFGQRQRQDQPRAAGGSTPYACASSASRSCPGLQRQRGGAPPRRSREAARQGGRDRGVARGRRHDGVGRLPRAARVPGRRQSERGDVVGPQRRQLDGAANGASSGARVAATTSMRPARGAGDETSEGPGGLALVQVEAQRTGAA